MSSVYTSINRYSHSYQNGVLTENRLIKKPQLNIVNANICDFTSNISHNLNKSQSKEVKFNINDVGKYEYILSDSIPCDKKIKEALQNSPNTLILSNKETPNNCEVKKKVVDNLCTEDELSRYLLDGKDWVPKTTRGFYNVGNTCYLNSSLQCLIATGPLLSFLAKSHNEQSKCFLKRNNNMFCGLCALQSLCKEYRSNNGAVKPQHFINSVRSLLSRMEDSDVSNYLKSKNRNGLKLPQKLMMSNSIRKIFGGQLIYEICCRGCNNISTTTEYWFNLSLDITCANSLKGCLSNYIRQEKLTGANKYKCSKCQSFHDAIRSSYVMRAPPILIIQFNRFSRSQKLDRRVDFPSSFDMRPFMKNHNSPVQYSLYATLNHEGFSCRSGHYVSYTKRNNQWWLHNDHYVSTVNESDVLGLSPYLLFYRLNTRQNIPNQIQNKTNGSISTVTPQTHSELQNGAPKNGLFKTLGSQNGLISPGVRQPYIPVYPTKDVCPPINVKSKVEAIEKSRIIFRRKSPIKINNSRNESGGVREFVKSNIYVSSKWDSPKTNSISNKQSCQLETTDVSSKPEHLQHTSQNIVKKLSMQLEQKLAPLTLDSQCQITPSTSYSGVPSAKKMKIENPTTSSSKADELLRKKIKEMNYMRTHSEKLPKEKITQLDRPNADLDSHSPGSKSKKHKKKNKKHKKKNKKHKRNRHKQTMHP